MAVVSAPMGLALTEVGRRDAALEFDFRSAMVRVGHWLGWISVGAVLTGVALGGARDPWRLVGLALAAAVANLLAMLVPWRAWLPTLRGRALLDLWSGGLIGFVLVLVIAGGPNFALLLFLAIPFIAVVQTGWRRGFWLAVSAATCGLAMALVPLPAGQTAMRLALVGATAGVALVLVRTIRREAVSAELERALAREASHRIKNDLQTVADLLLLGRPTNGDGRAFDETAARIRSIATVHRLLTETDDPVDAGALLRGIANGAPTPVRIEAEPVAFDAATAQKLGIVANELITNAFQHGEPPIVVRLSGGSQTRLRVDDTGGGVSGENGLGLELVRRMVEQGLRGRFELTTRPGGGTRADVAFPAAS